MWWSRSVADVKNEHWALDKKIPLAVIAAVGVQFLGTIWYVANLDSRVAGLEKAISAQVLKDGDRGRDDRMLIERMARVEEKLGALLDYVRRIDTPAHRRTEAPL
jgi:hypothetical protein